MSKPALVAPGLNREARILLYDIETSLETVAVFGLRYNDFINPDNIVSERHVVCICWQWLGETKVHSVSLLDDPKRFKKDPHDDYHVLETFHKVLGEADILVAHNGDNFDFKYLKTRMLVHKLPTLPPIPSIDTYKVAKQVLLLNSNKLDYIGKLLGLGGKKSTPSGLWLRVLRGEAAAIKVMVAYNKRDVTLLRDVFLALRPYVPNHVNRQLFGKTGCPRCGSVKVQSRGTHVALTKTYQRFHCQACGGWHRALKADRISTPTRVL